MEAKQADWQGDCVNLAVYLPQNSWAPGLHHFRFLWRRAQESQEHYSLETSGLARQQHLHGNPQGLKEAESGMTANEFFPAPCLSICFSQLWATGWKCQLRTPSECGQKSLETACARGVQAQAWAAL